MLKSLITINTIALPASYHILALWLTTRDGWIDSPIDLQWIRAILILNAKRNFPSSLPATPTHIMPEFLLLCVPFHGILEVTFQADSIYTCKHVCAVNGKHNSCSASAKLIQCQHLGKKSSRHLEQKTALFDYKGTSFISRNPWPCLVFDVSSHIKMEQVGIRVQAETLRCQWLSVTTFRKVRTFFLPLLCLK